MIYKSKTTKGYLVAGRETNYLTQLRYGSYDTGPEGIPTEFPRRNQKSKPFVKISCG